MKKLWIFLVIFCMMAGSVTVHADHDPNEELIGLQDFKTVRIPEPDGEIDPEEFVSLGKATTFNGWKVNGRCKATVCDGKLVYKEEV